VGQKRRLGILCGGGPAPGINSVIAAATIEAINSGWEVLGIRDGFEHLIQGNTSEVQPLTIADVSRIHLTGGTILYTSRANPSAKDPEAEDPEWRLNRCVQALEQLGIDALVTIGGDDTAFSASRLALRANGAFRVVHVPKTIDNDLPLPGGQPTFGFETARHVGVFLVNNLMTDAMTTRRWFFVVGMGRAAGHLALCIGKAAGASLTIIPEEFPADEPIRVAHLVDIIETTMLKRIAHGRGFGVAILAEGLGLRLAEEELLQALPDIERDDHGHIRLADLHLHRVLTSLVQERFRARGNKVTIVAKNVGYELRCAPPIPYDIEYTRDLGYGAIDYLRRLESQRSDEIGAMVTIQDGMLRPLPFDSFTDPETGRTRVRTVNIDSESYQVAREYMIRLEPEDLRHPDRLDPIARAAQMAPGDFAERYRYLTE
jgi:6-phosphofructokinase 1